MNQTATPAQAAAWIAAVLSLESSQQVQHDSVFLM
jgi:hypothetical protein